MTQLQRLDFSLKRADLGDEGAFTGLASVFNTPDRSGDIVMPGAFAETIKRLKDSGSKLPLLWNHNSDEPIGALGSLTETNGGLMVDGVLLLELPNADKARGLMQLGAGYLSIGYQTTDYESLPEGGRALKQLDLAEVSVAPTPMHRDARVTSVKKADLIADPVALERALRSSAIGLSKREAKRFMDGGYNALTRQENHTPKLNALAELLRNSTKGNTND